MPPERDVIGRRIGPLGEPLDGGSVPGEGGPNGPFRDAAKKSDASGSELFREPPSVEDRKPINTPLVTGVKPLDVLTPVGRGQCMLLTGEVGTNLSELGLNAVVAQARVGTGAAAGTDAVRCVYGAVGAAAADSGAGVRDAGRAGRGGLHRRVVRTDASAMAAATCAVAVAEARAAKAGRAAGSGRLHRLVGFSPRRA